SLPWLNSKRYDSDFRRDQAKVRAAESDAADYTLSISEEVHHLTVELDAARRQALLYRDEIIPLTEQALSSASAAWENNLGIFQDVLDTRRMLVENRLDLAQSIADQSRTLAELTLLTGIKDFSSHVAGSTPPAIP
ncbi:MAG TPA: TolC family protein, partial [Opitutaceae bacterium]|nr:TolC family protein [Opitutaceae bacterium]